MNEKHQTQMTDSQLISQAKAGSIDAFGHLYERYFDQIYRYVRSRVREDHIGEDLCEDVFLKAFTALDGYQDRGHLFSAFLYQVARNQLVDHYRKRRTDTPLESVEERAAQTESLDDTIIHKNRVQLVMKSLESLPEDYQEVIRLRILLELPTTTAAEWLNRSEGAVRVLLHRALNALREVVPNDE
jgi:RNA polymerase sigma-70 factor (ECF subfamily)